MLKKILAALLYFAAVIGLIVLLALTMRMSEEEALIILMASVIIPALVLIVRKTAGRRRRRQTPAEETAHAGKSRMARGGWKGWALCALAALCLIGMGLTLPRRFIGAVNDVPQSIAEFVRKYPEASAFLDDYAAEHGKRHAIDLTAELEQGKIPLFIQWDKRWGYESYGSNFIGTAGCGPTCLSMVLCGLTGETEWNPLKVAEFSEEKGYYVSGSGTSWALMTDGATELGLLADTGKIEAGYILDHLSAQTPMICSMRPGDFTYTGHYIVLTGMDSEGRIMVNDPNSPSNSDRTWELDVLLPQIKGIWTYSLET